MSVRFRPIRRKLLKARQLQNMAGGMRGNGGKEALCHWQQLKNQNC